MTSFSSLVTVCLLCMLAVSKAQIFGVKLDTKTSQNHFRNSQQAWLSKRATTLITCPTAVIKVLKVRRCVRVESFKSIPIIWSGLCPMKIGNLIRISRKKLRSMFAKMRVRRVTIIRSWKPSADKDISKFSSKLWLKITKSSQSSKHSRYRAIASACFIAIKLNFAKNFNSSSIFHH